jgi:hypothetical protein
MEDRDIYDVQDDLEKAFFTFNETKIAFSANRNPVAYFKLGKTVRLIADLIEELEVLYEQEKGNIVVH